MSAVNTARTTTGTPTRKDYWRYDWMPLNLRAVVGALGVTQRQFGEAILQANGKPFSETTISLLLGRGIWPERTPAEWIKTQVRNYLRAHKSPHAEDADLFDVDDEKVGERGPTVSDIHTEAAKQGVIASPRKPRAARPEVEPEPELERMEPVMLSAKARKHFSLFASPFIDDVQGPADVFLSADQRYVREAMRQACRRGGHMMAVVGESGSGKTTLRRETLDWVSKEGLPCVIIQPRITDKTHMNARHISEAILADLTPDARPARTLEGIARQIERTLQMSGRAGQNHVLMIEEAHDLAIQTLKFLKRFWEIEDGFKKLLSIVLIGQPELKTKLDARRYFEAREVINRTEIIELLPLDGVVGEYLKLKFGRLDKKLDEIIDADAIDALRMRLTLQDRSGATSYVYPLMVNNLTTRAMNEAAELGAARVTADIVRKC